MSVTAGCNCWNLQKIAVVIHGTLLPRRCDLVHAQSALDFCCFPTFRASAYFPPLRLPKSHSFLFLEYCCLVSKILRPLTALFNPLQRPFSSSFLLTHRRRCRQGRPPSNSLLTVGVGVLLFCNLSIFGTV